MWSYSIYNYTLISEIKIIGLRSAVSASQGYIYLHFDSKPVDLGIINRLPIIGIIRDNDGSKVLSIYRDKDTIWLVTNIFDNLTFFIKENTIKCYNVGNLVALNYLLLGPVLGIFFSMNNKLCIHSSAVGLNGNAFLFCGPSGAGKSTLAAEFERDGYQILADEFVPIDMNLNELVVYPGPLHVNLMYDIAQYLGMSSLKWVEERGKYSYIGKEIAEDKYILNSIIFLYGNKDLGLRKLSVNEALYRLVREFYPKFLYTSRDREYLINSFDWSAFSFYEFSFPKTKELFDKTKHFIESELANLC